MIRTLSIPGRLRATPSAAPTYAGQVLTNGVAADGLPLLGQYTAVNGPYGLGWQLTSGSPGVATSAPAAITAPAAAASPVSVMPSRSTVPAVAPSTTVNVIPAQPVSNYTAAEVPGNLLYTADLETVTNLMSTYGDTSDSAPAIVNRLYAAGAAPGSVTDAMALPYLSSVGSTAAAASSVVLSEPSTWPWYYWAAGAGALMLVMGGNRKR
jgi:hypothetical protein